MQAQTILRWLSTLTSRTLKRPSTTFPPDRLEVYAFPHRLQGFRNLTPNRRNGWPYKVSHNNTASRPPDQPNLLGICDCCDSIFVHRQCRAAAAIRYSTTVPLIRLS